MRRRSAGSHRAASMRLAAVAPGRLTPCPSDQIADEIRRVVVIEWPTAPGTHERILLESLTIDPEACQKLPPQTRTSAAMMYARDRVHESTMGCAAVVAALAGDGPERPSHLSPCACGRSATIACRPSAGHGVWLKPRVRSANIRRYGRQCVPTGWAFVPRPNGDYA